MPETSRATADWPAARRGGRHPDRRSPRGLPRRAAVAAVLASYGAALVGVLQSWPLWAMALAALMPWLPVVALEAARTYRHSRWLALFYVLVVAQAGHLVEHGVQMIQLHLLRGAPGTAHGIVGALDSEWVHFTWNTGVGLVVLALLVPFRQNRLLWLTALCTTWHGVEHAQIMWVYLATGLRGAAGFLAEGGLAGGGLPIRPVELHFLYNLIETLPLVAAFAWQCLAHREAPRRTAGAPVDIASGRRFGIALKRVA